MFYTYEKQSDGTYYIKEHAHSWSHGEIVRTGVRGCNVDRVIDSLYAKGLK